MRALVTSEINAVSGGFSLAGLGGQFGAFVGSKLDSLFTSIAGSAPAVSAVTATTAIGTGLGNLVGSIFDSSLRATALSTISTGFSDLLSATGKNIISAIIA